MSSAPVLCLLVVCLVYLLGCSELLQKKIDLDGHLIISFGVENQFGHFYKYARDKCKDPYPLERYTNETKRLLGVLEKRLQGREYLVDDGYSIADIATFPWVYCLEEFYKASEYLGLNNYPNVMAWKARCMARPAVTEGMTVCKIQ